MADERDGARTDPTTSTAAEPQAKRHRGGDVEGDGAAAAAAAQQQQQEQQEAPIEAAEQPGDDAPSAGGDEAGGGDGVADADADVTDASIAHVLEAQAELDQVRRQYRRKGQKRRRSTRGRAY